MVRSKKKTYPKLNKKLLNLSKSIWFFPAIGLIALLILTSLKISGTSIGDYYPQFYGAAKDPGLIAGAPRSIRSDEWEFETLMAAAQKKSGFPRVNPNIGNGQNMEVVVDAPYKNWTIIFKPHNLSYFILPFDYAFAFKWWLMAYLVVLGCYFLILKLLPRQHLLAALLSIGFFLSPFIQWWYRPVTLVTIYGSFFIILAFMNLWESEGSRLKVFWSAATGYLLANFAAVLYPPFQIPCALVVGGFLAGHALEQGYLKREQIKDLILKTLLAFLVFGGLFGGYVATNLGVIKTFSNTVYPGDRNVPSGGFDKQHFVSSFLSSQLQIPTKAKNYIANPSEAANFILLAPFLTIPAIHLLLKKRKGNVRFDWPLAVITGLFLFLLLRLFVPKTDFIFKPLLFGSVPHVRLFIGLGIINLLQLVLLIRHIKTQKVKYPPLLAGIYALVVFAINVAIGLWNRSEFPLFISNLPLILALAAPMAIALWLIGRQKFAHAAGLLLIFGLLSCGAVNPIYRGTGPIIKSDIVKEISIVGAKDQRRWIVADVLTFENLPAVAGEQSLTGIYVYPQKDLWQKTSESSQDDFIYNRFAHTFAKLEDEPAHLYLKQPDLFEIITSPCSDFLKKQNVGFLLSEKDYSQKFPCLKQLRKFTYPNTSFYIFEITS